MAIRVSANEDLTLEELKSKLGSLGLEVTFDEDDNKIGSSNEDENKENEE